VLAFFSGWRRGMKRLLRTERFLGKYSRLAWTLVGEHSVTIENPIRRHSSAPEEFTFLPTLSPVVNC